MDAPTLIVGAGLAGACAALVLSRSRPVVVMEAVAPAAGASGAAAGLANPFMGRKARPAWNHRQALDALHALCHDAGAPLSRTGIVRPASSETQAKVFSGRADEHPGLSWLSAGESAERWPLVAAPHGALWISDGATLDIRAFVESALDVAMSRGARLLTRRLLRLENQVAITDHGEIQARDVVLAVGDGARQLDATGNLPLHRVKGQTITVRRPDPLPADHPAISGLGYIVPSDDGVVIGATFEHAFSSLAPDPALDPGLRQRAASLMPCLDGAEVLDRRAGVRLTVPATVSPRRLPLAGRIGEAGPVVLAGFGAKGLMTAPLIAQHLPDALDGVRALPGDLALPVV